MSEEEKTLRREYRLTRKRRISYQLIAIAAALILTIVSTFLVIALNKTYYVDYVEKSQVNYGVTLKENEFFDQDYLDDNYEYVASLIDTVNADFKYQLQMKTEQAVDFAYTYSIDAVIEIRESNNGKVLYAPVYNVVSEKSDTMQATSLNLLQGVSIDYDYYNDIAQSFISTYQLEGATATLVLKMPVRVVCQSEQFDSGKKCMTYESSINIPLTQKTVAVKNNSTERNDIQQILSRSTVKAATVFKVLAIVFAVISVALAVVLLCFMHLSKNHDTTYEARLNRLLRNYKSFIQKINNAFDVEGYRVLWVDTFEEMLEIRDTIQSPILMYENEDKTCSTFIIANDQVAYLYELKVEDYDEIYKDLNDQQLEPEQPVILTENIDAEVLAEAMEQPDIDLDQIEFVQDDDDQFPPAPEEPGIEVIGVVWPERAHRNKVYRYDPNGEDLHEGDIVLVPTKDVARNKEIVRKAAVAHGNHRVDPEHIKHPLKKIIGVIKRNVQKSIEEESARNNHK